MAYEQVAGFAGSAGLIYMMLLFAAVLVYAFWPRNRARFDKASRIPFEDNGSPEDRKVRRD